MLRERERRRQNGCCPQTKKTTKPDFCHFFRSDFPMFKQISKIPRGGKSKEKLSSKEISNKMRPLRSSAKENDQRSKAELPHMDEIFLRSLG